MRGKKAETKEKVPKVQTAEGIRRRRAETVYRRRFDRHLDELRWLYMELYDNGSMFAELCDHMERFYRERGEELKKLDLRCEEQSGWYKQIVARVDFLNGNDRLYPKQVYQDALEELKKRRFSLCRRTPSP